MKKANKIKNWYYLAGPLGLVSLVLLDHVGGMNYPGYDWANQTFLDLLAQDSYDCILCTVFIAIALCLFVLAAYCVFKFISTNKKALNKPFKLGVRLVLCALVVALLGFTFVRVPQAGSEPYTITAMNELKTLQEEKITLQDEYNELSSQSSLVGSSENSDSTSVDSTTTTSQDSSLAEKQTSIDDKQTEIDNKMETIKDHSMEPFMLIQSIGVGVVVLIAFAGFIMISIFGFKRKGIKAFAISGIVCCLCVILPVIYFYLAIVPNIVFSIENLYGILFRVYIYGLAAFVAFISAWIYAWEPPVKKS